MIKHIEKKCNLKIPVPEDPDSNNDVDASDPGDTWINRAMGIYHQTKEIKEPGLAYTHSDTIILLNPSETVTRLLLRMKEKNALTAERVHELIAATMTTQWKNTVLDWQKKVAIHVSSIYNILKDTLSALIKRFPHNVC